MRLTSGRIEPFLARFRTAPDPAIRALLVYGPDQGLVRERATDLARAIVPDLRDPFRVAELSGASLAADPALLADEAQALSLTGGRRVLRVKEAGDAVGGIFERWIKGRRRSAVFP